MRNTGERKEAVSRRSTQAMTSDSLALRCWDVQHASRDARTTAVETKLGAYIWMPDRTDDDFHNWVFPKKPPTETEKARINQVTIGLSVLIPRFLSSSQDPDGSRDRQPSPVTHPLAVNLGLALWLWYRNHVQPCIAPILGLKRRKMALVQLTLCANIAASAVIRLRRDESPAADGFAGIHDGFVECLTLLSTQRFGALETMYHLYVVQAAKISLERLL